MTAVKIVAFRVDASLDIGSGHVMRCLTLANALREQGVKCHFICRAHTGHLMALICQRGFSLSILPRCEPTLFVTALENESRSPYDRWLACDWRTDARQTAESLVELQPEWLVVDHYGLGQHWEEALHGNFKKLMVIDDLADRSHICDLLLDQNLGRSTLDYAPLVTEHCNVMVGPQFALLRPEFAALREFSLKRRSSPVLKKLLITMGGVDQSNASGLVLEALMHCSLPSDCQITVVMGAHAPWLQQVRLLAATMPWPTEVRVDITDMGQVMAESDLAIGAAGSSSWERCCLGLPTLLLVLADNQLIGAQSLHAAGAACYLGTLSSMHEQLPAILAHAQLNTLLADMSRHARAITDGLGAIRVVQQMESL